MEVKEVSPIYKSIVEWMKCVRGNSHPRVVPDGGKGGLSYI